LSKENEKPTKTLEKIKITNEILKKSDSKITGKKKLKQSKKIGFIF
jgi:hypothetical protein